jgi:DDE superfamily endonuclease
MPPLPEAIILVLAPFASLFSPRVWRHAQVVRVGVILTPGIRTVTAALRGMGLAGAHHFTNDHRVLNRATWSARHGSRILLGLLITALVPAGATIVLGAEDTVARRSGRQSRAKGCYRDAVRSSHAQVIRGFGLKWVSMMLLVPVPWSQRVWALPVLTALCWPKKAPGRRRPQTRVDWVRQMMTPARRWLPGRAIVLVVDGGCSAVSLALACMKHHVTMVSRWRWDAALYHSPAPQPPGKRGPKPTQGTRQRSLQAWAERSDTPGETVEVAWYRGQPNTLWGFSRTAWWYTPRMPPVAIRFVLVCDPEGKLRLAAFFCTDLQATPVEILPWVVRRWSVEGTFEAGRAHLGLATQRQWSDQAIARTTPVLLALVSSVTLLAWRLRQGGLIPVETTAWSHQTEPPWVDCLALVRRHLWYARYLVNSAANPEFVQFPREAFELLLTGLPVAA